MARTTVGIVLRLPDGRGQAERKEANHLTTRYILNSAVLTGPGDYRYALISRAEAVSWVRVQGWHSRVGYAATAAHLHEASGVFIPLSREATAMDVGDHALVVRLKYRLDNPAQKAGYRPGSDDWEYGLLTRLA